MARMEGLNVVATRDKRVYMAARAASLNCNTTVSTGGERGSERT